MLRFPCTKNMPISVYIHTKRTHRFACMYDTKVSCAWVFEKTFERQQQSADDCLRISFTETCSFRGTKTRIQERFHGYK